MNESRWIKLMGRVGLDTNINTFNELLASYYQRHRHYHNVSHINAVLKHLDETRHLATDHNAIEIALWFHDAIYNVFSSSNELDSANWARSFLAKNGSSKEFSKQVHSLIMATLHDAIPAESDEKLMVDIDLSILGSAQKTYDKFESWIRREYKFVPDFIYNKKRKEILSGFLQRERIYSHGHFYEKLEKAARSNISNAIRNL